MCINLAHNAAQGQPIGEKPDRLAEDDEAAHVSLIERQSKQRGRDAAEREENDVIRTARTRSYTTASAAPIRSENRK